MPFDMYLFASEFLKKKVCSHLPAPDAACSAIPLIFFLSRAICSETLNRVFLNHGAPVCNPAWVQSGLDTGLPGFVTKLW